MKTVIEWYRELLGWKKEFCAKCNGHGMVSDYGWDGDFIGPKECASCWGSGINWKTPKGRYVVYPGGPFC